MVCPESVDDITVRTLGVVCRIGFCNGDKNHRSRSLTSHHKCIKHLITVWTINRIDDFIANFTLSNTADFHCVVLPSIDHNLQVTFRRWRKTSCLRRRRFMAKPLHAREASASLLIFESVFKNQPTCGLAAMSSATVSGLILPSMGPNAAVLREAALVA